MFNTMTTAFETAGLEYGNGLIYRAAIKQPKFKEGWSFSGSYKTFQALKAQGKLS